MSNQPKVLTDRQQRVLDELADASGPLSAYELLDRLRGAGFRAPPQVYRALERLSEHGLVHRLESLNAFIACRHPKCGGHGHAAFAICNDCGAVTEFEDAAVAKRLSRWAGDQSFTLRRATVELRGLCGACGDRGTAAPSSG